MAATSVFIAVPNRDVINGELDDSGITTGTATSATAFVELRVMTSDAGAAATNITRRDVCIALKAIERFVLNGGKLGTDANLPVS